MVIDFFSWCNAEIPKYNNKEGHTLFYKEKKKNKENLFTLAGDHTVPGTLDHASHELLWYKWLISEHFGHLRDVCVQVLVNGAFFTNTSENRCVSKTNTQKTQNLLTSAH